MDPNSNLKEQLELSREALAIEDACSDDGIFNEDQRDRLEDIATELAALVIALDEWIRKGGFKPERWSGKVGA